MNPFATNHTAQSADLSPLCRSTQQSLSEYMDNILPARRVWEIEKHLTACQECSAVSRQMQATVQLLHNVDRFDTSDDFMAKLHARLDGLDPEPAHQRGVMDWVRGALESARSGFTQQRLPVLNLGVAGAGVVALMLFIQQPLTVSSVPGQHGSVSGIVSARPTAMSETMHDNLQRNVALTANDPLGDVAAENLENMESAQGANSGSNTTHSSTGMDGG